MRRQRLRLSRLNACGLFAEMRLALLGLFDFSPVDAFQKVNRFKCEIDPVWFGLPAGLLRRLVVRVGRSRFRCNRCTRPAYSESLLMIRLARDDEEIGQCR